MPNYLFDTTLMASIRLDAPSEAEARVALWEAMDCATVNAGLWADGEPILFEASLMGEPLLVEADGEFLDKVNWWGQDATQFMRLLAEIRAVVEFKPDQIQALCESMDLAEGDIEELLERADLAWEKHKGNLPAEMTLAEFRSE